MSASWMRNNGMHRDSNLSQLRRRKNFVTEHTLDGEPIKGMPDPTTAEIVRASKNSVAQGVAPTLVPFKIVKRGLLGWLRVKTEPRILNPDEEGAEAIIEDPSKMGFWWNLRLRLFGHKYVVMMSQEEIDKLPRIDSTVAEEKYKGRWDSAYVNLLKAKTEWITRYLGTAREKVTLIVRDAKVGWLRLVNRGDK